jgi:hypothetical protein
LANLSSLEGFFEDRLYPVCRFFRFELGIVRRLRAGAVLACYLVTLTSP